MVMRIYAVTGNNSTGCYLFLAFLLEAFALLSTSYLQLPFRDHEQSRHERRSKDHSSGSSLLF